MLPNHASTVSNGVQVKFSIDVEKGLSSIKPSKPEDLVKLGLLQKTS